MIKMVEQYRKIKNEVAKIVKKACFEKSNKFGTDTWDYHIIPVVDHCLVLGKKMKADLEVLELAALLHDYAGIIDLKMYQKHHIHGARLAGDILGELGFDENKTAHVQQCILCHRASVSSKHLSVESKILASADAMSHISELADMFHLAYGIHGYDTCKGARWLRDKLQRSWKKIMPEGKALIGKQYAITMRILDEVNLK